MSPNKGIARMRGGRGRWRGGWLRAFRGARREEGGWRGRGGGFLVIFQKETKEFCKVEGGIIEDCLLGKRFWNKIPICPTVWQINRNIET